MLYNTSAKSLKNADSMTTCEHHDGNVGSVSGENANYDRHDKYFYS